MKIKKIEQKIKRGRNIKNNSIEQIASAITELAKAQTQPIIPTSTIYFTGKRRIVQADCKRKENSRLSTIDGVLDAEYT